MKLAPHRPVKSWQIPQKRCKASTGSASAAPQRGQVNDSRGITLAAFRQITAHQRQLVHSQAPPLPS
jgi:hypothetical protein